MALPRATPAPSRFKRAHTSAQEYLRAIASRDPGAAPRHSASSVSSDASSVASVSTYASTSNTSVRTPSCASDDGASEWYSSSDPLGFSRDREAGAHATPHSEYGICNDARWRYESAYRGTAPSEGITDPPYYILFTTYISFIFVIALGHLADWMDRLRYGSVYGKSEGAKSLDADKGLAPLTADFDSFYTRRLKKRLLECFNQPTSGVAGRTIRILDRISTDWNKSQVLTGTSTRTLNISSYNYLGFAQAQGGCAEGVEASLHRYGISTCGTRMEGGSCELHLTAERLVANFVGAEDALISSMGFATNSTIIPALVGKGCLIISDELNHSSIRFGARLSGAHVRLFKHNDMSELERVLREAISQGQHKTHRPWRKILVVVEGLYSMEGTMVDLPGIMALKSRYRFYLFIDEAHSIGALGPHGRGVCDYYGIRPRGIPKPGFSADDAHAEIIPGSNVDVLMGTFTKSFGAAGGYIAGTHQLIDNLRVNGHGGVYAEAMTPSVLVQIITSMASIMGVVPAAPSPKKNAQQLVKAPAHPGLEGSDRLRRLAFNSRYLSRGLNALGFITCGHDDSPIVPLIIWSPGKMVQFHRLMLQWRDGWNRGIDGQMICQAAASEGQNAGGDDAVRNAWGARTPILTVVVSYPATPLITSRVRFCVSAAHTKQDMDIVLRACDQIGDWLDLKHGIPVSERWDIDDIVENAAQLVEAESFL
ncbi:pyridoxal phosphate-dependent transferase [Schizophyllum fasciatum]